jgi:hypothetical protein
LFPCIAISTRTDREPCCKTWPCRVLYLPLPSPVRTSATLLRRHGWAFTGHSCAVLSYLLCHSGCRLKPGKVQLDTGGYSSLWRMSNLHCNKSICSSFHSSNASSSQSQAATACPQMSIASVRAKKSPVTLPIACLPTALCKKALVCALYHPVCLSTQRLLCRPKIPPVCNLISAISQTILRQPTLSSTQPSSILLPSSSLCFASSAKLYQKESLGTTWLSWQLWRSLPYLSVSSSIVSIHI